MTLHRTQHGVMAATINLFTRRILTIFKHTESTRRLRRIRGIGRSLRAGAEATNHSTFVSVIGLIIATRIAPSQRASAVHPSLRYSHDIIA